MVYTPQLTHLKFDDDDDLLSTLRIILLSTIASNLLICRSFSLILLFLPLVIVAGLDAPQGEDPAQLVPE